jgi:hypothetical protein
MLSIKAIRECQLTTNRLRGGDIEKRSIEERRERERDEELTFMQQCYESHRICGFIICTQFAIHVTLVVARDLELSACFSRKEIWMSE